MKTILIAAAAAAALSGCAAAPDGPRPDPIALRDFAIEQIVVWNALGVDPLQADPRTLALMTALCGTASTLVALSRLGPAEAERIAAFCQAATMAAGPAR